ncbi:peptidoglycan-binding protein [Pseudomonadota bacterium]
MNNKLTAILISAGLAMPMQSSLAQPVDKTNTLPDAKPGQCYAKVMVPAKYETRQDKVLVREAAQKIDTIPAKYEWAEKTVTIQAAHTKLVPEPAKFKKVVEKIETSPAMNIWVTSFDKNAKPASPGMLTAAKVLGVKIEEALPGMCFKEYYTPTQFKTEIQDIVVKDASEEVASIPAEYETIVEQVMIKEASKKIIEVPATYETVSEKVLIEAAKTVWKKGTGPIEKIDNTTGEIMCLVEIPAKYKTVKKQVVKTAATTKEVEVPAVYKTVKVRKLITPEQEKRTKVPASYKEITKRKKIADARFAWHGAHETTKPEGTPTGLQICLKEIPAKYQTVTKLVVSKPAGFAKQQLPAGTEVVKVRKLVANATEKRSAIPAEYKTVAKRAKVSGESLEWQQVLCETNMTKDIAIRVQQALKDAGYNIGVVDGIPGGATMRAVDDYQRSKGLPTGGLTIRTLESLGVGI